MIERMSFQETPHWKDMIGFQVRLSLRFRNTDNNLILQKGSLIYGFKQGDNDTYGFLFDNDEEIFIEEPAGIYYITIGTNGLVKSELGSFIGVKGLGENVPGIPWYTYNGRALIAKVFKVMGVLTSYIVCDDPYWCEKEEASPV